VKDDLSTGDTHSCPSVAPQRRSEGGWRLPNTLCNKVYCCRIDMQIPRKDFPSPFLLTPYPFPMLPYARHSSPLPCSTKFSCVPATRHSVAYSIRARNYAPKQGLCSQWITLRR